MCTRYISYGEQTIKLVCSSSSMARVRTLPTFRCPSAFVFWHPSRPHSRGLRTHRNSLLDQDRIVDRHVKDRMVWSDSLKSSTSALYVNPISIVYSRKPRRSIHDIDSWKWTSIEVSEQAHQFHQLFRVHRKL